MQGLGEHSRGRCTAGPVVLMFMLARTGGTAAWLASAGQVVDWTFANTTGGQVNSALTSGRAGGPDRWPASTVR